MAKDKTVITLTDKQVDLSGKDIGSVCEIALKVKKVGEQMEPQYDMPMMVGEKEKKVEKYVNYRLEVLDAKYEKNAFFDKDTRTGPMYTKGSE